MNKFKLRNFRYFFVVLFAMLLLSSTSVSLVHAAPDRQIKGSVCADFTINTTSGRSFSEILKSTKVTNLKAVWNVVVEALPKVNVNLSAGITVDKRQLNAKLSSKLGFDVTKAFSKRLTLNPATWWKSIRKGVTNEMYVEGNYKGTNITIVCTAGPFKGRTIGTGFVARCTDVTSKGRTL